MQHELLKKISLPFLILLTGLWVFLACNERKANLLATYEKATFEGSESCKSCHEDAFSLWQGSHHDQAMKIADSTTILADFNNTSFKNQNTTSTFFKKDGAYFVNLKGPDGSFQDYEIKYTYGVTPLQQYIIAFPNGAFQCLQTAWDTEKKEWFDLQPDLTVESGEWIHWSGGGMRWNTACADCHSTDLKKNYDVVSQSFNTTFSEINVSCEACHGPGSNHNAYYESPVEGQEPPPLAMPIGLTGPELVDACARCHSRRTQITAFYDYTDSFFDHYIPTLFDYPTYELDGQIKDEDYVYGSFMQSKMYHNGISCRDCHDVHSLKLKKTGNDLCMTCHVPEYNTANHHFHEMNTEAAQCINCHMTGDFYMGNDFRRDHSFRVPRPDQSLAYGTPNACIECHTDKDNQWATDFIIEKYGSERADHFSDYLLAGAHGNLDAYVELLRQKKYPEIARATAMSHLTNYGLSENQLTNLLIYLKDSSALVRHQAVIGFEKSGNPGFSTSIEPMLTDSVRQVRIAAARYFNMLGIPILENNVFEKAHKEYMTALDVNADFAGGQHQIALFNQAKGNTELAIAAYRKSIQFDNYYNQSKMNLAFLLYQTGQTAETEALYLDVINQEPEFSYAHYMLGLLYHEIGNIEKAKTYLYNACTTQPPNENAFYNYSLILQQEGELQQSIDFLNNALLTFPNSERLLYVKLVAELNSEQRASAMTTITKLIELFPSNSEYKQIYNRLQTTN